MIKVAGAFPSIYVSRFNPVLIFQDKFKLGERIWFLILPGFNFLTAVNTIIPYIYYYQNADFQNRVYPGYDRQHIICVPFNNNTFFEAYWNAVSRNPMIESIL